ncbi:MAG: biotin/lipoyl-binding protein [Pyrinomonadaceae bacterium]|nr:biotin/lipoyl-binding protein [Pyrinomonadaceae bacterium]
MKLTAEVDDQKQALDIRREGDSVVASVDERRYELQARETEPGVYLLIADNRVYECRVENTAEANGAVRVEIGGSSYEIVLSDPKRLRAARSAGVEQSGRAVLKATMPGKVVRVLVEAGAEVEAGAGVIVVEAMKMQNELKSPKSGRVVEITAQEGATVNAGEVLAVIE